MEGMKRHRTGGEERVEKWVSLKEGRNEEREQEGGGHREVDNEGWN